MHGQFTWYDLNTSDVKSALSFYPALTGWGTEDWSEMEYTMWTVDGTPLGGVVQLTPEQKAQGLPNHWMPYVEVRDVDQSAAQAQSLGGKVWFGPQDIPGTGRFAVLSDPQGATFAVYKPLEAGYAFDGTRHLGRFVWHELLTSDMDAAFNFYRQMFQWEETSAFDMGPEVGLYRMFGQKGGEYGGMFNRSGRMAGMQPFWTCYVHVKDVEKAAALATKRGGQVVNGPMEVPGGDVIAVIMDPQGAAFAIHQGPKAGGTAPAATPGKPSKKKAARKAGARKAKGRTGAVKRTAKQARKAAKRSAKAAKKAVKRGTAKVKRRVTRAKVKRRVAKAKKTVKRRTARRR